MNPFRNRELRKQFLIDLKTDKPCFDCRGAFPWYCLDFDHVPERGPKFFEINQVGLTRNRTMDEVLAEVAKCDLVCSNCHRIRTHERRYPGKRVGVLKDTCVNGHDLTNPRNQNIFKGKRKGCSECRRINDVARDHNDQNLTFQEKEEKYPRKRSV